MGSVGHPLPSEFSLPVISVSLQAWCHLALQTVKVVRTEEQATPLRWPDCRVGRLQ